jgi:tripartite ATP-independent transporter DctM subunit
VDKVGAIKSTWAVLILFPLVIGGIYLGVFSPTEAAGVGACGAFIIAMIRRRLSWSNLKNGLIETVKTTSMIFIILLGAMILGYFLAVTRLPFELAEMAEGLPVSRYVILIFVMVIFLFLGCVMDSLAIIILTVPIFFPLIDKLGFDAIWFGILVVRAAEIGLITPPVGLNVFIIKGIAKDVPMYTIFRGIVPFLIADLFEVALLMAVPQISLFLPSLMK